MLQNVIAVDHGKVIGVNEGIPVDSVTDGDMRPVTSNAVYNVNNNYDVLASATSTVEGDISNVNWNKYKFIVLQLGMGGAYGSAIIPACLWGSTRECKFIYAYAFGTNGNLVASGIANLNTNKLTTTHADYPAILYGIY